MGNYLRLGVTLAFIVSDILPAHAFWIEPAPGNSGIWQIHCKNRVDFLTQGQRTDAVVKARAMCEEITKDEERGVSYRAVAFENIFVAP